MKSTLLFTASLLAGPIMARPQAPAAVPPKPAAVAPPAAAPPAAAPPAASGGGGGIQGMILNLLSTLPGVVVTAGGLDVAASVCETFKPGNSMGAIMGSIFGSPYYGGQKCEKDTTGGSGKYKANYTTDPTLPYHTIYAPLTPPPASEKMPVIIWGNGACLGIGTMFQNFLTDLASHGFLVIANGDPVALAMTTANELMKSIDWVTTNPAAKKYGNIDLDNLAIAGQSCGGMEAYQASYATNKHKLTVLFNSGSMNPFENRLNELKKPVAFFLGGTTDMAQRQGMADYMLLPKGLPALVADVDVGHIGTYYQMAGGKLGRAGTDFFRWKLKGEESLKSKFCGPDYLMAKEGWDIQTKNGMC